MPEADATAGGKDAGNEGAPGSGSEDSKDDAGKASGESDSGSDKTGGKQDKTFTQAEVDQIVQKRLNKELKKFQDEKDLTETEKLKRQNDELQKSIRERDAYDEFDSFFGTKGVKNTKGLFRALKSEIEYDDAGKIKNLKGLLVEANSMFPEMFPNADGDADAGKGESDKSRKGGLTKEMLEKMSPAEINKLDWNEVQKVLKGD